MIAIKKTSQLTQSDIDALGLLQKVCTKYDGFETHLYWGSLKQRPGSLLNDFVFSIDGKLVGYLGFFMFEQKSAEICALVHPKHRKNAMFTRLLEEAIRELKQLKISHCFFIRHPKAHGAKKILLKLGSQYDLTEFKMQCTHKMVLPKSKAAFSFQKAKKQDLPTVAKLSVACFEGNYEEELEQQETAFTDKKRGIYLAALDKEVIGKVHYVHTDSDTILHDFCILPKYQGKGLTSLFLKSVINRLFQYKSCPKTIMITTDKPKVVKLYQACGFEKIDSQEYWRFNLVTLNKVHSVLH